MRDVLRYHSTTFKNNVQDFFDRYKDTITQSGYDGIDLDWEGLSVGDTSLYESFLKKLRTMMNNYSPHKFLTVAIGATKDPTD